MRSVLILSIVFSFNAAYAEQKQTFGEYEIHYIGLTSSFLTPEIAKAYGIERSRTMGYVSISVLKTETNASSTSIAVPVDAILDGSVKNFVGQRKSLEFKRIKEGSAIYFISTLRFDENEEYNFSVNVKPEGTEKTLELTFKQKFYNE